MDNDFSDLMELPVEPSADWLSDEEVSIIEQELEKSAMEKIALMNPAPAPLSPVELKSKRQKEADLLKSFKADPGQHTFMPLYTSMRPMIYNAALSNMARSPIPQAAHMALAAQSFYDATRTFDANKGSSFTTHMFNTVREKGKRLNLKYQNIGYIPETRATKYQGYQNALHLLKEELGREPSDIEVADESGMPVREIERMRKEITTDYVGREYLVSKGMGFAQSDKAMQIARDIYPSLEPKHQVVLEHMVGLNGKESLVKKSGKSDIASIAKKSGLKLSDVRSARKTIARKFKDHRTYMGTSDSDYALVDESED